MRKIFECVVCGGQTPAIRVERNKNGKKIERAVCDNCWRVIKNDPENKAKVFKGE